MKSIVFVISLLSLSSLLISCTSTQYTPTTLTSQMAKPPVTEKKLENKNPTEKYGRFTVEISPDGIRKIYGGKFKPPEAMPYPSKFHHAIFINYQTKELTYYRFDSLLGKHVPVVGYAVVTPSPESLPKSVVRGVVTKMDMAPDWYPSNNIRREMPHLPKGRIPYGHELNAMGEVKFHIFWEVKGWDLIRLHGTEGYSDHGRFWELETFGCTRLQNRAILELTEKLGIQAVKEKIEVVAHKKDDDL